MNLCLLVFSALHCIQQSHPVQLSSDTESAYTFSILYNFHIASHPTIIPCVIYLFDPKQLYR